MDDAYVILLRPDPNTRQTEKKGKIFSRSTTTFSIFSQHDTPPLGSVHKLREHRERGGK